MDVLVKLVLELCFRVYVLVFGFNFFTCVLALAKLSFPVTNIGLYVVTRSRPSSFPQVRFQELSIAEIHRCTVATRIKNKDVAKIFFTEVAIVQLGRMSLLRSCFLS
jgi:hypothetical protein